MGFGAGADNFNNFVGRIHPVLFYGGICFSPHNGICVLKMPLLQETAVQTIYAVG